MRRPALIASATIVLLLGATAVLFVKYRKTSADYENTKVAEEATRARYTEAFNAVVEIQDSLNAIALGDTSVRLLSGGLQGEQKPTELQRRQALDRIAVIDASIRRNKDKIHRLETSLARSGIRIAGLERMIANLKQTVAEKEEMVGQLTGRVDSLQTRVTGLEVEVQQSQETIRAREQTLEEKRRELATVYYVVGTKKELTTSGIILAKGGILGLGRTLQPSGHYNEDLFTPLDTDRESIVRIPAAKARVLSAQLTSSYELKRVGSGTEFHVLDPRDFRKVRHLIILTK